jgi:hypothetical protein
MLKSLVVLAVLFAITQTPVPTTGQTANYGTHASAGHTQPPKSNQNRTSLVLATLQATSPGSSDNKPPDDPENDKERPIVIAKMPTVTVDRDWLDYATFGVGLVVLGVGFFGVLYAKKTLGSIADQATSLHEHAGHFKELTAAARKSAEAARDGAEAAMLNAQAVINSERAWLTASVRPKRDRPGGFVIVIKNRGNTPAKLLRLDSMMRAIVPGDPENLVIPNDYNCPEELPDTMFIVKGFMLRHRCSPETLIDSLGERSAIAGARKFLMVYGRIQYEDVFHLAKEGVRIVHDTCWCYVYDPTAKKFRMGGPDRYTKNT